MPVIRSAAKKLRQAKIHTVRNRAVKDDLKKTIAAFRRKPTAKEYPRVVSKLSKAAKLNIIHSNKSARLASRLSKLLVK